MKQILPIALTAGFTLAWLGCGTTTEPAAPADATGQAVSADMTLVTLSVPNMF